jgi:2'-5' RNA ligase
VSEAPERALRLFVAVDPSPEVRARLRDALARVKRLAPSAKWVDPVLLHVTLSFLGHTEPDKVPSISAALAAVAARHAPVDLSFSGAGSFGGKRPRVLWIGIGGGVGALVRLQQEIAAALAELGFPAEERPYSAHLTLARAREARGDPALAACAAALSTESFGDTRVGEVLLYRSDLSPQGPTYTAIATHPLAG